MNQGEGASAHGAPPLDDSPVLPGALAALASATALVAGTTTTLATIPTLSGLAIATVPSLAPLVLAILTCHPSAHAALELGKPLATVFLGDVAILHGLADTAPSLLETLADRPLVETAFPAVTPTLPLLAFTHGADLATKLLELATGILLRELARLDSLLDASGRLLDPVHALAAISTATLATSIPALPLRFTLRGAHCVSQLFHRLGSFFTGKIAFTNGRADLLLAPLDLLHLPPKSTLPTSALLVVITVVLLVVIPAVPLVVIPAVPLVVVTAVPLVVVPAVPLVVVTAVLIRGLAVESLLHLLAMAADLLDLATHTLLLAVHALDVATDLFDHALTAPLFVSEFLEALPHLPGTLIPAPAVAIVTHPLDPSVEVLEDANGVTVPLLAEELDGGLERIQCLSLRIMPAPVVFLSKGARQKEQGQSERKQQGGGTETEKRLSGHVDL